jgi:SAM-dependent methyltransferase
MKLVDSSGGYVSFVAEFYDHVVPYQERGDIEFFVKLAKDAEGNVLEIGSGTGRVLIPTARAGKEICGIDASAQMLSICNDKLSNEPEVVRAKVTGLHHADMRDFTLDSNFGLVTMPFRSFQHLITSDDQQDCLNNIQRHLKRGARFAFDVMNPSLTYLTEDRYLSEFNEEPPIKMADGRRVIRHFRIRVRHLAHQFIDAEIIYYITHLDGHVERLVHSFQFRYVFRFEVEHLLARCGFSIEAVLSDFDGSPFGSRYPGELIILARKC